MLSRELFLGLDSSTSNVMVAIAHVKLLTCFKYQFKRNLCG